MKTHENQLAHRFGNHLKKIRVGKNLSLRALAQNCNLDDSNISKMENGKLDIRLSTIVELARGLGIEPKELLDFEF